ncbi:EpsG family protein [Segatella baroniae]|uniref:EpsG family protein n=1 Tax=Segatella baroniae TaxID=305719 RepID=UPI000408F329|nr:EpsG family protein [Segatella baroniae]
MLEVIFWSLFVFLVLFPKSEVLFRISFFLLGIIFCLNTDNADRIIYQMRLEQFDVLGSMTEVGFTLLMYLFTIFHLDLQWLYVLVGICFLTTLFYVINKSTKYKNFAIAMYMMALFLLDIVQIRFTCSVIFLLIGLYHFYNAKKIKKATIKYVICIVFASLFHYSTFLLILLAPLRYFSIKKTIKYTLVIIIFMLIAGVALGGYLSNYLGLAEKFETITEAGQNVEGLIYLKIRCGVLVLMSVFLYCISYYLNKNKSTSLYQKITLKIAITEIAILPLLSFSADFRRLGFALYTILLCGLSEWAFQSRHSNIIKFATIIVTWILFNYMTFINYQNVYRPIFDKNIMLEIL